jgi:hypothetical protein
VSWLARLALAAGVLSPALLAAQARGAKPALLPLFSDITTKSGIEFVHQSGASPDKFMVETFGSGVAWIDYDNDGFPDLYFVNGAPGAANALYHNNKDGTFTDVTARAGVAANSGTSAKSYKTGVAVGDYDNDGNLDLYAATERFATSPPRRVSPGRPRSGARAPASSITIATAVSTCTS